MFSDFLKHQYYLFYDSVGVHVTGHPCVSVPPGAGWVAGGGKACCCAIAHLCQQTGSDDSHPSVWAGRKSQFAHHPRSHVAGPGLLSSHGWGSAGKYSAHSLQTHSMNMQWGLREGGLQSDTEWELTEYWTCLLYSNLHWNQEKAFILPTLTKAPLISDGPSEHMISVYHTQFVHLNLKAANDKLMNLTNFRQSLGSTVEPQLKQQQHALIMLLYMLL